MTKREENTETVPLSSISRRGFLKSAAVSGVIALASSAGLVALKAGETTQEEEQAEAYPLSPDPLSAQFLDMITEESFKVEGASEGYLETFRRCGVDYIFSSPGSEFTCFWEYLAKFNSLGKKPVYMNARHEGLAVQLAGGYAMATGKPQVVLLHVNIGPANAALFIHGAYLSRVPMLIIAGWMNTHEQEIFGASDGAHYLGFTDIGGTERQVEPFVKWMYTPENNLNVNRYLLRGLRIADTPPRGPTFIMLSRELMFEKGSSLPNSRMQVPVKFVPPTKVQPDPEVTKKIAELLVNAENPLIISGTQAWDELVKLAETLSIPVVGGWSFPSTHPLYLGGSAGPYLKDADVIFCVENLRPWYPPRAGGPPESTKVIVLDSDPTEARWIYWGYPVDLLAIGDTSLALSAITDAAKRMMWSEYIWTRFTKYHERFEKWSAKHDEMRANLINAALAVKSKRPISTKWLCYNINEVISEDDLVLAETITHTGNIRNYIDRTKPNTNFSACGGLGGGMGTLLGVKVANMDKTCIALEGDGSFNYCPVPACFGFAQEYKVPFLTIVFDNESYAAMNAFPKYYPGGWAETTNTKYGLWIEPKPDYVKMIEANGGYGEVVEDPDDIKPALLRALDEVKGGRAALLDVLLGKGVGGYI